MKSCLVLALWASVAGVVHSASGVEITSRVSSLRDYRVNAQGSPPLPNEYDESDSFSGLGMNNLQLAHGASFRSNVTQSLIYASGSGYRQLRPFQSPDIRPELGTVSQMEVLFTVGGTGADVRVALSGNMTPSTAHTSPEQENMFLALYKVGTNELLFDSFSLSKLSGGPNPMRVFDPNVAWSSTLAMGEYRAVIGFLGGNIEASGNDFYGQGKGDVTMSITDVVPAPGVCALVAFALFAQPRRRE